MERALQEQKALPEAVMDIRLPYRADIYPPERGRDREGDRERAQMKSSSLIFPVLYFF